MTPHCDGILGAGQGGAGGRGGGADLVICEEVAVVARDALLLGIGLDLLLLRDHDCHHKALQDRAALSALATFQQHMAQLQQHGTTSCKGTKCNNMAQLQHGRRSTLWHNFHQRHKCNSMVEGQHHGVKSTALHTKPGIQTLLDKQEVTELNLAQTQG